MDVVSVQAADFGTLRAGSFVQFLNASSNTAPFPRPILAGSESAGMIDPSVSMILFKLQTWVFLVLTYIND